MKTYIYTLSDPRTNLVRYIGKTNNIEKRYREHLNENRHNSHKCAWIKNLKNENLKPIIEILDEVPENEWGFWEIHWISLFKTWGFNLTNLDQGGLGGGIMSEETKKKISLAKTGKTHKGVPHSEETKEKLRKIFTGRKIPKDQILKKIESSTIKLDLNELKRLYESNLNYKEIGELMGVSSSKIYKELKKNNLIKLKYHGLTHDILCVETGKIYSSVIEIRRIFGNISITTALKKGTMAGGYHWEYILV